MKIYNLHNLSIERTNNENYSFSWKKEGILCLSKRSIETVLGGSILSSVAYNIGSQHSTNLSSLTGVGVGLLGTYAVEGFSGCLFEAFIGTLYQNSKYYFNPLTILTVPHMVGQGILLASGLGLASLCLAFLIKSYGNNYLKTTLDNFNRHQNKFTSGIADISYKLKYEICKLTYKFFSLQPSIYVGLSFLGFIAILDSSFSVNQTLDEYSLAAITLFGAFSSYKLINNYVYLFPLVASLSFSINLNHSHFYYPLFVQGFQTIFQTIGLEMLLIGGIIKVLDLMSNLSTKNKAIDKFIEKLINQKKAEEYKKSLEEQKTLIETRAKKIQNSNSNTIVDPILMNYGTCEDVKSNTTKHHPEKTKKLTQPKKAAVIIAENKNKTKNLITTFMERKFKVDLNSNNEKTWNELFNDNKSKPNDLIITHDNVKFLIKKIGGKVKNGEKNKKDIFFGNKRYGWYEAHKNVLLSGWASFVRKAIIEAYDAGLTKNISLA